MRENTSMAIGSPGAHLQDRRPPWLLYFQIHGTMSSRNMCHHTFPFSECQIIAYLQRDIRWPHPTVQWRETFPAMGQPEAG